MTDYDRLTSFPKELVYMTASTKPESEAQIVADLKQRARDAGETLAKIMTEASRHGMQVLVDFESDAIAGAFVKNVRILKAL